MTRTVPLRRYPAYRLRLPPKRIFFHSTTVDFVEERREQLDVYLRTLLADPNLCSALPSCACFACCAYAVPITFAALLDARHVLYALLTALASFASGIHSSPSHSPCHSHLSISRMDECTTAPQGRRTCGSS